MVQASDRRQGLTCAHKQPQGLLLLSACSPVAVPSPSRCALCSLVLGPQFSHMHVPSWRCSPKYMHSGGAVSTGVKAGQMHGLAPPVRAGCWCSWRCTRLCRCWKGQWGKGSRRTQLALVCMNTYGAKASDIRRRPVAAVGHWFPLQW